MEISGHPAVKNHARRLEVKWSEMLLDKSYHYAAMKKLHDNSKRGRPDIVHFALMEALSTPLFIENKLRVYVHTANDKIIAIADNLRIPKSYSRFEGLMVKLFAERSVKSEEGAVLMELADGTFQDLLESIAPDKVIGLSTTGVRGSAEKVARMLTEAENCVVVVGGFPKGHFGERTTRHLGPTYAISDIGLEAHVVIARVVYECEKAAEVAT
ncbi:MAG TPA: ribosome biogenesis protein [Nitrososphaera sp.]|nr:ribosome biogenesis protein [Nitrososphaera sp.]